MGRTPRQTRTRSVTEVLHPGDPPDGLNSTDIRIMHVIGMNVTWVFAVPAVARVRRSSPVSRPSPAGDLRSALTPAAVRRVDEAAGSGKMGGVVGCMVQASLPVVVGLS